VIFNHLNFKMPSKSQPKNGKWIFYEAKKYNKDNSCCSFVLSKWAQYYETWTGRKFDMILLVPLDR
jgi:hypothetical protein